MTTIMEYNWAEIGKTPIDNRWATTTAQRVPKEGFIETINPKDTLAQLLQVLHSTNVTYEEHTFTLLDWARDYFRSMKVDSKNYHNTWSKWMFFLCRDTPTHIPMDALSDDYFGWLNDLVYVSGPDLGQLLQWEACRYLWMWVG